MCLLLLLTFMLVWLRTAWLSDDAGISMRVVLNFISGSGPVFNVDERVQSFTHPLWFLLLSFLVWLTGELYYTTLALSLACTLAVYLLVLLAPGLSTRQRLLVFVLLLGSRAFTDFSSSGLENPLSHLLLLLFTGALYRWVPGSTRSGALLLIASLLILNRQDLVLLVAPALALWAWQNRAWQTQRGSIVLAALPLVLWFGFSLVYFGVPFPNTAYAKLATGVERADLWMQGLHYLADSLARDYLTLPVIALATLLALLRGDASDRALALGVLSYLLYLVSIGGDFMSGRFLSAPLMVSALLLARRCPLALYWPVGLALVLSLASPRPVLLSGGDFRDPQESSRGVMDERAFYYPNTGLWSAPDPAIAVGLRKLDWSFQQQRKVREVYTLGLAGLQSGPEVHVYDPLGIADPLVSRLPQGYGDNWRPGHFQRRIPVGLHESLELDANRIAHPELAAYYDDLRLLVRGPLWTRERWGAIWRVNTSRPEVLELYNRLGPEYVRPGRPFHRVE